MACCKGVGGCHEGVRRTDWTRLRWGVVSMTVG